MSSYRIFTVEPLGPMDQAMVITTASRNTGGYPRGEWFVIIPDDEEALFAQVTRFNYREFPEGPIKLDEDFIHREMLDQAKLRLRVYIHDKDIQLGQNRWDPKFNEADSATLAHCWVRGKYSEQLAKIFRGSECDELREVIHWLGPLEKYQRRDL